MDRTGFLHVLIWLWLIDSVAAVTTVPQSLLGCGVITRPMRTYQYSPANYDFNSNTPGACMQACSAAGYAYASVSAGRLCFCGSSSVNTALLNTTLTSCEVDVCTGDSNYYCGDLDHELVYTSIGIIDSANIALNGGGSPMQLNVNQNYQFDVTYVGAVNYINYLIDFGDGTQTGWFSGTLNTTTSIPHIFSKTGQFSISVAARSLPGMTPIMTAMTVKVSDVITAVDISMTCPNVTTTLKTVSCLLISARGSSLTANINYNTTSATHSVTNIPDAQYYTFGSSYVTNNPTIDASANLLVATDVAILPQSIVTTAGRIGSIQFYSSGAGSITIYLLRRVCTSPMIYCYEQNTCGYCNSPYSLQCGAGAYSTISHLCNGTNPSQRFQQSNYNGVQFSIVAQWTANPAGPGYQQIIANSVVNMMNTTALVGDILAFQGLNVAKTMSSDSTEDYRCVLPAITSGFTCTTASLSSNNTQYRYLLQITIIQAIQIAPNTMFSYAGNFNVQGTITQANVTSFSTSTILPVVYGIEWIEIIGPSTSDVNILSSFIANIYPANATATSYMWFINNNNTFNSTDNMLNISFPAIGTYVIGCQAQNLLSMRYNSTTITVQDLISNFTLHAGNISNVSTSQPLETARFQIRMASGSNYACRVNYDTSQSNSQLYFYTYGYIPGSYVTYQYIQPGEYQVSARCENSASNASYTFTHYVQYPIVGLQLQQRGVIKNTNFRLNFTIAQGTAPQFRVLINGVQVNHTYDEQYKLVQTTTFPGQSTPMNYTAEIYAWNYISSSYVSNIFTIDSSIVNPQIRASTTQISFPGPILFEYTMESGSNVQISFSFGDTLADTPVVCNYAGDYPSNTWNSCSGTNHIFEIPGTITIIVGFTNAIGTIYKYLTVTLSTSVKSIQAVTSLQLGSYQCSAAYVDNRAIASFKIQALNATVKPASNAQVLIIPDMINYPSVTQGPFQLTLNYFAVPAVTSSGLNVIYSSPGNYTAMFQVSNSIDSINVSCMVHVVPILQQVYYSLAPANWPFNDPTSFAVSVYIGDPNPGNIIITWDFGDGTNISRSRTVTQYDQPEIETHRYTSIGTYLLTIMATGSMNTVTKTVYVNVQYPVLGFNVNFSSVAGTSRQIAYSNVPTTISITVQDTSIPAASNAYALIDYNDTSPLAINSVINVSLPYTGSYTYFTPGIFNINFTVYNRVSSQTQIMKVSVDAPFSNYQFTICYLLPTLMSSLSDECNLPLTSGRYYIPKQSQLVIYVGWSNPSGIPETFDVSFSNASNTVFTQTLTPSQTMNASQLAGTTSGSPLYRLVVDLESNDILMDGAYTLLVTTRNPSYSSTRFLNIYVLSTIAGLSISDQSILVPRNIPKSFVAVYQNFSSISCLYIQYSDNSIECYGDITTCSSLPSDVSMPQTCPSIQPYNYQNSLITFTRTFNQSSAWIYAYAWNRLTQITAQSYLAFPLSTTSCGLPVIEFNIFNPVMRWARQIQRSEAFSVTTNTILNCSNSLNNTKQWTILECNVNTGNCFSTAYLNQLISQLSSARRSEIYIRAQVLPLGTYLFNFTVSMNSQANFAGFGFTYISIVASDLKVNMLPSGTSMITAGVTQSVLFQPGVYTIDPDSNYFDPTTWTFAYYCRIYGQASYPRFNGEELPIESTNIDPLNPSCFDSPGNLTLFKYGPNNNRSILYIQPRALQSGRTYEFKVILTNVLDSTVQYTGYTLAQIQEIDSVIISTECIIRMCSPNAQYQRINPTTQAAVTSRCETCANATNIDIQWGIYRGFQPGFPNNDIQWILFPGMDAFDNDLFFGRNTMNLTVANRLFSSYPSIQYWKFEVSYTVTTTYGTATGLGAIRFSINSPPENGTCSIDQTNGTTITVFKLSCSNWIDSDGVQDYLFYAYTSANGPRNLVGFTTLESVEVRLPNGDANANYALKLLAEIRDIHGAIQAYDMGTITVVPDNASLSNFYQLAQQAMTQGRGNDEIARMLYAGDQNQVCQLMLSISQMLNNVGSSAQQTAVTGDLPAQNLGVAGLSASTLTYPTTNTSANTTQAMADYNAALNAQAIVRDYAVQFINDLSITTIDSIILQSSTLSDLTETTSELTRQTVASAASKCNDLINSLNEMADTVSYETVQQAATSIVELASNVLVAVNTPLLDRGTVIGLDYDRANTLPPDYDGDIESVWSNPNMFADGDDFSWETIQKNRNMYYQQQSSSGIVDQIEDILSKAVNVLSYHLNVGQKNTISTDSISMITEKLALDNLNSLTINASAGAKITLPPLDYCILFSNETCSNSTPITVNSVVLPLATAGQNGRSEAIINMSRSVSLNLFDTDGTKLRVQNLASPIKITIPRDPNLLLPSMTLQNLTGQSFVTSSNNNRQFSLYYVNVTSPSASLTLSATFEFKSSNLMLGYVLIFRFDAIPVLNSSMNRTDGYRVLCPTDQISTASDGDLYSYFLANTHTVNHEYVMFGLRELSASEFNTYCLSNIRSPVPINDVTASFTDDIYVRAYTSGCYYYDEQSHWKSDGLVVGSQTTHGQTECYTTHLTTFAGGWVVLPAPINWNYVFANLDFAKNKTIYLTIILLAVLYILFMIYARYKDKKDVEKLGVTPLPDNLLNDKYYYQIIVFTGLRRDAGTSSKVHFIISGDNEETGVRTFEDPQRKILQRGGIDSFIMAVPKSLGRLNYMRVWHDNTGRGGDASWFLKYIVVRDLQTMEKNHFISQQWFAVEKSDGMVDRIIPVAGEEQKLEFAYLLSKKTYHSMSDGHLWFSVFSRPPSTRFTRTQRCTCCFVLLMMSMLMNIMYYDQSADAKTRKAGGLIIGPFLVTPEQIAIGVIVELICFLPSTILVEMFRRLRLRRRPVSPVRQALQKIQNEHQQKQHQATINDIHPQLTNYVVNPNPILSAHELDKMRHTLASPPPNKQTVPIKTQVATKGKKKKQKKTLPWWFIFIAYGLSFLVVSVSALFIIARGIEFGDTKTQKWLTSSIAGFFSSVFLTQPVKVICLAIFFALIIRRDDDEIIETDDDDIFLEGDEEYLHAFDDGSLLTFRSKSGHVPLSQGEVAYAREKRLNELKMWDILRELLAYVSFLWILYVVSYANRDPNAFFLMNHLRKDFLNVNNATTSFTKIYTMNQYWDWLDTVFIPTIRVNRWYNDAPPTNLSGYINDKTNRILGWPTMRQLRVQPDSCKLLSSFTNIISSCEAGYNLMNEDKRSFNPGWSSLYNATMDSWTNYSSSVRKAFLYNTSDQLDTYTYIGEHATYGAGGYVYEFRGKMSDMMSNVSALRSLSWLDMQTRAVMIQLSLYNPNVNLFTFVTILVEFLPTGGLHPSARFEPISLLNYYQGFALFKLICAIVYMIFIIYFMQHEIRSIFTRRMKYFRDFWSYPEIGIIVCSWAGFGVYIWRIYEGDRVGDLFRENNGYAYVNLQLASYVNDVLTFLLGFCCFFGTIKFLRLLRFNHRISMLSSTLSYAARDLLSFTLMFSIIYFGYLTLFFLLFHSKIWACSDPLKTAQMLFEMMLLKFDVSDLYAADIFLGPFCFSLFVIFVVFICMNMFISIISDAFRLVRHNISLQSADHEIVQFMINQFKKWTGLGKTQELDRLHLNPYDGTTVHYLDPISQFPEKIDELLIALNKIYMDTKRHDTFLFRPVGDKKALVDESAKNK